MRYLKRFGQHFLNNETIAKDIVDSLEAKDDDIVVEIGPGNGVLTKYLYKKYPKLILIEIDDRLIEKLQEQYPKATIIHDDVLNINFSEICNGSCYLISNLPYNISSEVLFKVHNSRDIVRQFICMLQYEVAERILAHPGSKQYGIPSIFLNIYYDIEFLMYVSSNNFYPEPKVNSAVIKMTRNNVNDLGCDEELFDRVVYCGFQHRRKTLRNALHNILPRGFVNDILSLRAEQLSISDYVSLIKTISCNLKDI